MSASPLPSQHFLHFLHQTEDLLSAGQGLYALFSLLVPEEEESGCVHSNAA